jgi:hypothetical protein
MKFRSFLLFACMVFVPLMAMFSHKIPPSLRQVARERIWDPMKGAVSHAFDGGTVAAVAAPHQPAAVAVPPAAPPPVEPPPKPTPVPKPKPVFATTPAVKSPSPPAIRSLASEKRTIEIRLAELGAYAFDCATPADGSGLHRCSCRVAADSSGQLQRVFQAADRDPVAAMQNLLGQVQSWREQIAAAPTAEGSPLSSSAGRSLRF